MKKAVEDLQVSESILLFKQTGMNCDVLYAQLSHHQNFIVYSTALWHGKLVIIS